MSLLQGPAWLAGVVMVEKQPGRWQQGGWQSSPCPEGKRGISLIPGVALPWTSLQSGGCLPHEPQCLRGPRCCTAPTTLGAFCIKRGFAEFSAVMLGPCSLGQGFLGLFPPLAGTEAEPSHGAASLQSN